MKNSLSHIALSFLVSLCTLGIYHFSGVGRTIIQTEATQTTNQIPVSRTVHQQKLKSDKLAPDFTLAASQSMSSVVHISCIQTVNTRTYQGNDAFWEFFGFDPFRRQNQASRQAVSTGSGVIIDASGYIVTNNHVIKEAEEIEVTLYDNRTYQAAVVGTDPSTDLALLQIQAEDLSVIPLGNSDNVMVGEWVLAVGNPFSLSSTVTAGIVSAIGRNIDIIEDQMPIESFIQTDAAVNPGNSGGALVNMQGELIGINTAIATPTGTYAGYAFAVPVSIVEKVIQDLKNYGMVQRGFLGIGMKELDGKLAKQLGVDITEGVLVVDAQVGGSARDAGIVNGDVIIKVNEQDTKNIAKLQEEISRFRPGDEIAITVHRKGFTRTFKVFLKNEYGNMNVIKKERHEVLRELGMYCEELSEKEQEYLGVKGGVKVVQLYAGKVRQQTRMKAGYIIVKVDDVDVYSVEDFTAVMNKRKGKKVKLAGGYLGYSNYYYYNIDL